MSNKRNRSRILLAAVIAAATLATAYGVGSYMTSFESTYPAAVGTSIDKCTLCHTSSSGGSRNSYGSAYASNGYSYKAIESLDSDGDGFTNLEEIKALTFPGSASSKPAGDTTVPTVTAFSIPSTASTLTVSITTLTATDNVGVTGYLVNESSTKPSASAAGWSASKPTNFTFGSAGSKTLYAWAKDAANNVSNSLSASTTITLPPAPDTTAPTVTGFAIPGTATTLTVSITTLTATDNVGVTGYLVNESSTKPSATAGGWSASKPASYTFGSAGSKTLYAWAKDAANNVSNSLSASTTITLPPTPDTTAPTVTGFAIPGTATTLTVSITTLTATDAVGVTGYLVNESSTKPSATAGVWSASKPASYTFGSAGSKTLYAWAKDAANNVSNSLSAATTITLPPTGDTTAPTITAFTIPATATSLTVSITSLVASDNVGITGYMLTESSTKPAASGAGWTASSPSSYTFGSAGAKTLYAWAKDAAGNVSSSKSASTTITIAPATDTIAPTITTFAIPPTSTSLTVAITSFSASDNVATTGYMVTESPTKPGADGAGWKSSAPSSYSFATSGSKVLYGWAKDAAGNVSNSKSAATTVTSSDNSTLDMSVWEGTWFKVRINRNAGKEDWKGGDDSEEHGAESEDSGEVAYLKIQSWNADTSMLQASIYYQNGKNGPWASAGLPFHYTSGDPGRFLFWFEYAGEFQFAAGMIAKIDGNMVVRAKFNAAGIYLYKTEEEMGADVNLALTMSAGIVSESKVPVEALELASAQTN
jgi:hypothetical protein